MKASDVLRLMGRPVAYYKDLSRHLGGATAAILFSQLFFWSDKTTNPLGVYKQLDELCEETGLTLEELRTARKKLTALRVLVETHKRLEHRIYFRIDFDAFDELMEKTLEKSPFGEQGKTDFPKQEKHISRNGESPFGEQGKTDFVIDQENTTEDYNNNTPLPPQGKSADADGGTTSSLQIEKNQIDYQGVMFAWNLVFADTPIPKLVKLNDERRRKISKVAKELISEFGNANPKTFEDYFRDFLAQATARKDKFYFGGVNGEKWIADFDYVMRPATLLKTLENGL